MTTKFNEFSLVYITICIDFFAFPIIFTFHPLTLIFPSACPIYIYIYIYILLSNQPFFDSMTLLFVINPLSSVFTSICISVNSISVHLISCPISIIFISIIPCKSSYRRIINYCYLIDTMAMSFSIHKLPFIFTIRI